MGVGPEGDDTPIRADGRWADFERGCFSASFLDRFPHRFWDVFLEQFVDHFGISKMIPKCIQNIHL